MSTFKSIVVAACLFSFAPAGLAQPPAGDEQSAARSRARDPGDAKAAVPTVTYSSAFARYRANAEAEVGNWRDRNDAVGRIGGWRTYGREASEPDKPANAAQPAAKAETPRPSTGVATKPHHEHAR
jgi:hypothetical protein